MPGVARKQLQFRFAAHRHTPALLSGTTAGRRDLPWRARKAQTPRSLSGLGVCEVMLQQTTSDTVTPSTAFPAPAGRTVEALAEASLDDLLAASDRGSATTARARSLHRCARFVAGRAGRLLPGNGGGHFTRSQASAPTRQQQSRPSPSAHTPRPSTTTSARGRHGCSRSRHPCRHQPRSGDSRHADAARAPAISPALDRPRTGLCSPSGPSSLMSRCRATARLSPRGSRARCRRGRRRRASRARRLTSLTLRGTARVLLRQLAGGAARRHAGVPRRWGGTLPPLDEACGEHRCTADGGGCRGR